MPKKFVGENSKSAAARARKEEVKNEKKAKEQAAKEDAYWADNDKAVQKKLQRKVYFTEVLCLRRNESWIFVHFSLRIILRGCRKPDLLNFLLFVFFSKKRNEGSKRR